MNNIKVLNDLKDFNYKLVLIKTGRHVYGDRFFIFVIPRRTAGSTWEYTIVHYCGVSAMLYI